MFGSTAVIRWMGAVGRFWYEFVVGDDWRISTGVVAALGITALLARTTALPVWWIVVVVVLALLPLSIRRSARGRRTP
jgi:hypothetical protein